MAINTKEYLLNRIRELYPDESTRPDIKPGSVFYDLLILPLANLLNEYQDEHQEILDLQSLSDPTSITEEDLDAVALNFLLTRNSGTKAAGYVKFYYNHGTTLSIENGTILVTDDGLEYEVSSDIYVPKVQMDTNISEYPYYDSGEIYIIAKEAGTEYNKRAETQFTIQGETDIPTPVKIVNAAPFTSGTVKEGNQTFFNRITDSVYNKSMASKEAIDSKIKETFTTVIKTEVVGAGNDLMVRDLANLEGTLAQYAENDFYLTYSGQHSGAYDSKHIAYVGVFQDVDESENVEIPPYTSWSTEFSNDMYQGLYLLNDMEYAYYEQDVIFREDFGDIMSEAGVQPSLALVLASGQWYVHDGVNPTQDLFYLDEIDIQGNELVLGKNIDPDETPATVSVPLATISGIMDLVGSDFLGTSTAAYNQLGDLIAPVNFNNVSPIIHRQIDQHLGIYIDLTMRTTDNTNTGEMCYITVLRNSEVYLPHDGYGLAWRKQPAWLIRIDKGTYTSTDIDTFKEHYNNADPVALGLVGNLHKYENKAYWKYNVYLVDNDVLQEEVWIGHDQLWDQTSGKNAFLVAGKAWIEPDIDYSIRAKIYQSLGFEGWIYDPNNPDAWADGDAAALSTTNRILYRGSTYPPFVPVSGDRVTRTDGTEVIQATYNHFGIGVAQTRNCEWYADDLVIRSFIQNFPMHLFRFKINTSEWSTTDTLTINYYGLGYDPYLYAEDGSGHSSVKCVVYKPDDDDDDSHGWVTVGTHTNTLADIQTNVAAGKITKSFSPLSDYLDEEMYVNIAVSATNSGPDFENDAVHALRSYYIQINNTAPSGLHRGNAIDVYVHDPTNLKTANTVVTMSGNRINTNTTSFRGYIADIVEVREYLSKVPFDTSAYSLVNNNDGTAFTANSNYDIVFDADDMTGTMVEVEYLYWTQGDLVNNLLTSSDYRYPAADIAAKTMPLHIVNVEKLEYSGGLKPDLMKQKIIKYFAELTERSFDKSDLVDLCYDNGANYVDLDIVVRVRYYDTTFTKTTALMEDQTYLIGYDTVGAFYTNEDELIGVEQV